MDTHDSKLRDYIKTILDGYLKDYGLEPAPSEYEQVLNWAFRNCENFAFMTARECVKVLAESTGDDSEDISTIHRLLGKIR